MGCGEGPFRGAIVGKVTGAIRRFLTRNPILAYMNALAAGDAKSRVTL